MKTLFVYNGTVHLFFPITLICVTHAALISYDLSTWLHFKKLQIIYKIILLFWIEVYLYF